MVKIHRYYLILVPYGPEEQTRQIKSVLACGWKEGADLEYTVITDRS